MEPKILVPIDDSPTGQATVQAIIAQKERFPKTITLLYVINKEQLAYRMIPDFQLDMVKENAQKAGKLILDRIASKFTEAGFNPVTQLELGAPRTTITDIANEGGYQLVVIGRHEGGGEIRDVLFGSVANYVLHNVKCPVLLF
ncbi:MAG: universal stress protein [Desulfotalea sp.]